MLNRVLFSIDHRHTFALVLRPGLAAGDVRVQLEHLPDGVLKEFESGGPTGTNIREQLVAGTYRVTGSSGGGAIVFERVVPSDDHATYVLADPPRGVVAVLRVLSDSRGAH